ncbi:hypothetical protein K432DRAFT_426824 [Lepidopterella palustris CBS 459.81]|uniref:Uncharacterized protein n=1 Tax=Lepidopterella palustris CBS 459.81 TaxID=1314670 RepID=A0A8E2JE45_9PEZI|nr:hypothetical protein K432DRAFT_426824 [Lepidopterella palustris CBS 459.81]
MGSGQPYLYDPPKRYSAADPYDGFNPKAVTMASRRPPPPPKPKPEGPLINFNRHPDSYLILPYGNTNAKPMSPRIKTKINWTRWIQLFLRVLQFIGTIGILICVICIRGTQDTEGWIIRIAPGVDIPATLYAIYHLMRASKGRTPASSASYHFFALIIDAGLIPFYVFTAIMANRNYNEVPGTDGRWRTFFPTDSDANKVLQTTWLTGTTLGGLHCASIFLDLYLVFIFRKISRLPPDMNPLEDNLTSRRKTNHKHKNSSISAITPLTADEKRISTQSGSTVSLSNRGSQVDPLIPNPDVGKIPFFHTRAGSDISYSPHNPTTARLSRTDLPNSLYQHPASTRASRADLNRRDDLLRKDDSDNETLSQRKSFLTGQQSRPNSQAPSQRNSFISSQVSDSNNDNGHSSQKISRESLQSDNWFVHSANEEDPYVSPPTDTKPKTPSKPKGGNKRGNTRGYNAVPFSGDISDDEDMNNSPMVPQPLRMNPPTPPPVSRPMTATTTTTTTTYNNAFPPSNSNLTRTHTTSLSTDATFTRSPTRASTPKGRYYGDLKAATQGIRNSPTTNTTAGTSPTRNSPLHSPIKSHYTQSPAAAAKAYTYSSTSTPPSPSKSPSKPKFASIRRTGEAGYTAVKGQSPRVVSRSGVDVDVRDYSYEDLFAGDLGMGGGRQREVSGKVAEEGRGGVQGGRWKGLGMGGGLSYRKVSGVA